MSSPPFAVEPVDEHALQRYPKIRDDLIIKRVSTHAEEDFVVKDPVANSYFEFNELQVAILRRLDGATPADVIAREVGAKYDVDLDAKDVRGFARDLGRRYLLELASIDKLPPATAARAAKRATKAWRAARILHGLPEAESAAETDALGFLRRAGDWLSQGNVVEAARHLDVAVELDAGSKRIARARELLQQETLKIAGGSDSPWPVLDLVNPERALRRIHRAVRFVFSRWFVVLFALLALFSTLVTVVEWQRLADSIFSLERWSGGRLLGVYLLSVLLFVIHEFGHGVACVHYGGRPRSMGVMLFFYVAPAAFCDTSDTYLFKRRRGKVVTFLAGVGSTTIIWCLVTPLLWVVKPNSLLGDFVALTSMLTGFVNLFQFLPLMKLDGYHVLVALSGRRSLAEDAWAFLRDVMVRPRLDRLQHRLLGRVVLVGAVNLLLGALLTAALLGYGAPIGWLLLVVCLWGVLRLFRIASGPLPRPAYAELLRTYAISGLLYRAMWPIAVLEFWWRRMVPYLRGYAVLFAVGSVVLMVRSFVQEILGPRGEREPLLAPGPRGRWIALVGLWLALDVVLLSLVPWSSRVEGDARIVFSEPQAVRAAQGGQLVEVLVHEGQRVEAGEVMLRLSDPELDLRRAQLDAARRECDAELALATRGLSEQERQMELRRLARARLSLEQAADQLRRARRAPSAVAREELRRLAAFRRLSVAALSRARAERQARTAIDPELIKARRARCRGLLTDVERLDKQRRRLLVRAPTTGVVTTVGLRDRRGSWIEQGQQLLQVANTRRMHAELRLDQRQPVRELRLGARTRLFFRSGMARPLDGRVSWIAPALDTDGRLAVRVALDLQGSARWIRGGMTGRARVQGAKIPLLRAMLRPIVRFISVDFWKLL